MFEVEDDSSNTLLKIWHTGHMENIEGYVTTSPQYGPGLWVYDYGDSTPEHTNQTGSYDHTGGASETLFTKSAGDDFTQADADNRNFVLLTGANLGASAEIKEFIDADNVVVDGMGWAGDIASQTFVIYKHPSYFTGDGYHHEFSVDGTGEFEVAGYDFTGSKMFEIENDINADNSDTMHIVHEANGKNNTDAIQVFYHTGDMQTGDEAQVQQIVIDDTGATDGEIDGLLIETVDAVAGLEKHAIHVGVGFDSAFRVSGASADDMDYGYVYTAGSSPVAKVVGDDSFINTADDEEVFSSANDFVLIGNDDTFEVLSVVLETGSSKDLELEFYYSNNTNGTDTGVAGWTQFYPDDSTQGFQQSGVIDWTSWGAAWDEDDLAESGEAITEGYYIAIKRTRVGDPPTDAVEDIFQVYLSQSTGMNIDGFGVVQVPYLGTAPSGYEVNGKFWAEADGFHGYIDGGEITLATPGAIDTTAVHATTWSDGSNASNVWTMDNDATDTTVTWASGLATFSHDIVIGGSDLTLNAAGVKITGSADGDVTFLGLGDGADEDINWNLDDTADTLVISSSTSVGKIDQGSIDLDCGAVTSDGILTGTALTAGSAVLTEAELEKLDGITDGTAAANKAVVLDASSDVATINSLTATTLIGALTGNADSATVGTTVTITDNEDTAENNPIVFVAGADPDGGNLGLESDGTTHYNPSTGTITATQFVGGGAGLTAIDAATGDSATDFFDAGEIVDARVSDTLTASIIDLEAGTISNIATTEIMVGVGANDASYVALSGDVTLANDGTVTIGNEKIDSDMYVDGSIDEAHMSANSIDSDSYVDASIDDEHLSADITESDLVDDRLHFFCTGTIYDPGEIQEDVDAIAIFPIEAETFPNGVTFVDLGIKTGADTSYSVVFEEWTDPQTQANDLETVATSTSDEAEDDGTIGNGSGGGAGDCNAGSILKVDLPDTDIDDLQIWGTFTINAS